MQEPVIRFNLKKCLVRLEQVPAIALLGSRQVGKTTLSKQVMEASLKDAIYLDLESPEDLNKLAQPELYLNERSDKLILIDEVQRFPALFPILRSVIDRDRTNGRFVLLGSASPELMAKSSETLAGRVAYFDVEPFTFNEVEAKQSWQKLWLRGGYPNSLLSSDDAISFENRIDFIKNYLEIELPSLGLRVSSITLRNLLKMLSQIHGNLINYSDLSRSLGLDVNTVKRYIDYFEYSFIIRRIQPYFLNISKRLVKSPKLYYRDSGIFHALAGVQDSEDLESFVLKGNSWEGFVIQNIIVNLKSTVSYYFYRTQDGTELDLVLVKGNQPFLGIEVKYSNTPKISKSITLASNDLGNIPVLVITPSATEDYYLSEKVQVTSFERMFRILLSYKLIEA